MFFTNKTLRLVGFDTFGNTLKHSVVQHHGPCPHSAEGKLEPWIISELHIDYNVILFFVSMELYDSIWAEGNSEILIIKYLICYWAKIVLELNLNPKWLFKKNNFSMLILLRREPAGITSLQDQLQSQTSGAGGYFESCSRTDSHLGEFLRGRSSLPLLSERLCGKHRLSKTGEH